VNSNGELLALKYHPFSSFLSATWERSNEGVTSMKIKVIVHEAEEGGYWAEVPAIPGCATQGETFEELLKNLYEAVEGCLSVDVEKIDHTAGRVIEIAV
jgi:predicted RNase H-like HicB family nuclease